MPGERQPGPVCTVENTVIPDTGTLCIASSPTPGPIGFPQSDLPPVTNFTADATQEVSIYLGAEFTWDSITREIYNKGADAIRQQAEQMVRSARMTPDQAKVWANGQRNALIEATRKRTGPIGRAIAEIIKPSSKLKTVADLEKAGKSATGIIASSGKTNPFVNRVTVGMRFAGPALIIVGLSFSAYNIYTAPPAARLHVGVQEAGKWGGALAGGFAGGVGGCKVGAAIGTFFGPGPGNGAGCLVGTVVGTVGGAIAGGYAGGELADYTYRTLEDELQ